MPGNIGKNELEDFQPLFRTKNFVSIRFCHDHVIFPFFAADFMLVIK